jgi:Domain of unknown function (DUF4112)
LDHPDRIEALRKLKRLLDEAFRVPGTSLRFGWDPIIGLVPWVGDLLTALMGCAIVVQAHQMRVPGVVQLRMLLNIGIDLVTGVVPVVGDAFDFFWKSNAKNFALLERHAPAVQPATRGDWIFVVGIIAAVVAMAAIPLIVLYLVVQMLMVRHPLV